MPELGQRFTTGSEIDWSKPFLIPFLPGEKVRHRASGDVGVVLGIVVTPASCMVDVSFTQEADHVVSHLALESADGDDGLDGRTLWEFPWPWGHAVVHRADGKRAIVTGYRINERGIDVHVSLNPTTWGWCSLYELNEALDQDQVPVPAPAGEAEQEGRSIGVGASAG